MPTIRLTMLAAALITFAACGGEEETGTSQQNTPIISSETAKEVDEAVKKVQEDLASAGKRFAEGFNETLGRAKEQAQPLQEEFQKKLNAMQEQLNQLAEENRDLTQQAQEQFDASVKAMRDRIEQTKKDLEAIRENKDGILKELREGAGKAIQELESSLQTIKNELRGDSEPN